MAENRLNLRIVMEDEIKSDRSPRSPNTSLSDAIEQVRKLHAQIGRARVKPESAAVALGYKGANNGAALTTFATLSQYGLIERSKGEIAITPLAVRIMHPTGEDQRRTSLREAALNPPVLADIHENFNQCSPEVLTSHLVQRGFTPDRAKRTAEIHAANKGFAYLGEAGTLTPPNAPEERKDDTDNGGIKTKQEEHTHNQPDNMLAQYRIPLGPNEATLVFTGNHLTLDDFDALIDFVEFSKRQFERALNKATPPTSADSDSGKLQQDNIGRFGGQP